MPFTPAHAILVLPAAGSRLRRVPDRLRAWMLAAFVAGAMVPDAPLFLDVLWPGTEDLALRTHGWASVLTVDLVLALAGAAVWVLLVRPHWLAALPRRIPWLTTPETELSGVVSASIGGDRSGPAAGPAGVSELRWRAGPALVVGASAVLGLVTHLVWDDVTHLRGGAVQAWGFLREPVAGTALYKYLQHGSSALGVLVLMAAAVWWWRRAQPVPHTRLVSLCVAVAGGVLLGMVGAVLRIQHDGGQVGVYSLARLAATYPVLGAVLAVVGWAVVVRFLGLARCRGAAADVDPSLEGLVRVSGSGSAEICRRCLREHPRSARRLIFQTALLVVACAMTASFLASSDATEKQTLASGAGETSLIYEPGGLVVGGSGGAPPDLSDGDLYLVLGDPLSSLSVDDPGSALGTDRGAVRQIAVITVAALAFLLLALAVRHQRRRDSEVRLHGAALAARRLLFERVTRAGASRVLRRRAGWALVLVAASFLACVDWSRGVLILLAALVLGGVAFLAYKTGELAIQSLGRVSTGLLGAGAVVFGLLALAVSAMCARTVYDESGSDLTVVGKGLVHSVIFASAAVLIFLGAAGAGPLRVLSARRLRKMYDEAAFTADREAELQGLPCPQATPGCQRELLAT